MTAQGRLQRLEGHRPHARAGGGALQAAAPGSPVPPEALPPLLSRSRASRHFWVWFWSVGRTQGLKH